MESRAGGAVRNIHTLFALITALGSLPWSWRSLGDSCRGDGNCRRMEDAVEEEGREGTGGSRDQCRAGQEGEAGIEQAHRI